MLLGLLTDCSTCEGCAAPVADFLFLFFFLFVCSAVRQADIATLEKEVKLLRGQSNLLSREVSKKESTTEKQKGAAAEKERLLAEKLEEVQEQAQTIQALQVPAPSTPSQPQRLSVFFSLEQKLKINERPFWGCMVEMCLRPL